MFNFSAMPVVGSYTMPWIRGSAKVIFALDRHDVVVDDGDEKKKKKRKKKKWEKKMN
jgi:hypothetical protein